MPGIAFESDPEKNAANLLKHGIGFVEVISVFADPLSITIADPDHSIDEARYVIVGMADKHDLKWLWFILSGDSASV